MNTSKAITIISAMALAALSGLFWLATEGNTIASAVLFSLWTILCVVIGWGLSILQQRQAAREQQQAAAREQAAFAGNMKENLMIMSAMATAQNKQSAGLAAQLERAARMPGGGADSVFQIEDGIFSELEG